MPRLTAIPSCSLRSIRAVRAAFTPCPTFRPELQPEQKSQVACWLYHPFPVTAAAADEHDRARTGRTGEPAKPLVAVKDLGRIFDVSKPWLNRVTEGLPRRCSPRRQT
jgi:hypothetical protein